MIIWHKLFHNVTTHTAILGYHQKLVCSCGKKWIQAL